MTQRQETRQARDGPEAWITGIGLISSRGDSGEAHCALLSTGAGRPVVDEESFAPYSVHPLGDIDFPLQIPRKGDLRQMGRWQRIGVYAAGLALADAGLVDNQDLLDKTNIVVAAGNGERDEDADGAVLRAIIEAAESHDALEDVLNETLQTSLRPTLYLSELSNLLAGNISIVHGATGSSRTYKGEEMAGVSAVEDAARRIASSQGELFLVGGAFNSERADLTLTFELCDALWRKPFKSVWERARNGGGFVMGSVGAFLLLEADTHAIARGQKPYAKITSITSGDGSRSPDADRNLSRMESLVDELVAGDTTGSLGILSGASGVEPATSDELKWLNGLGLDARGITTAIRAYGTMVGHSVEAHFPAGIALAALAISKGQFFPPFDKSGHECSIEETPDRILVSGWGHWRGNGLALVESAVAQ